MPGGGGSPPPSPACAASERSSWRGRWRARLQACGARGGLAPQSCQGRDAAQQAAQPAGWGGQPAAPGVRHAAGAWLLARAPAPQAAGGACKLATRQRRGRWGSWRCRAARSTPRPRSWGSPSCRAARSHAGPEAAGAAAQARCARQGRRLLAARAHTLAPKLLGLPSQVRWKNVKRNLCSSEALASSPRSPAFDCCRPPLPAHAALTLSLSGGPPAASIT
jgi:hypothetical protein